MDFFFSGELSENRQVRPEVLVFFCSEDVVLVRKEISRVVVSWRLLELRGFFLHSVYHEKPDIRGKH